MRTKFLWMLLFVLAAAVPPVTAQPGGLFGGTTAAAAGNKEVAASLEAARTALVPGQRLEVALKLVHPPHWHTYWMNPGIGVPTTLEWELPEGWSASPLVWPIPKVKPSEIGNLHIYEDTTWIFCSLTPPASLTPGTKVTLQARAKWLVCDEGSTCNPGGAALALTLPVAAGAAPVPEVQKEWEKVEAAQPRVLPQWSVQIEPKWVLTLTPEEGANPDPGEIYFFDRTKVTSSEPPEVTRNGNTIRIALKPADEDATGTPAGFVHASKGWLTDGSVAALQVGEAAATTEEPSPKQSGGAAAGGQGGSGNDSGSLSPNPGGGTSQTGFLLALGSLFLAGMILNLMPCVFPVLALKVLGFAQQAGKDPAQTRRHSFAYTLGLLTFVWLIAGGMYLAKQYGGLEFAWGDLTRYSGALAVVIIVLFLLGLNLAGVFEIGTGLGNVGVDLQDRKGYAGSFWSGALTMLISTPCSGPFMAVAMGYALQQSAARQFVLFTFFGLGVALPYVLLAGSPRLLRKLPRPGAWMETFRKALSFPMFGAAVYFFNAFAAKTGEEGSSLLLWALLFAGLAAWVYGHWCLPSRPSRARWMGGLAALAIAVFGGWLVTGASKSRRETVAGSAGTYQTRGLTWLQWSPEVLAAQRAQCKPVFVNYTTIGCVTCDTNEKRVFKSDSGSDELIARFKELGVVPLRAKYYADGTPADNAIRESLKEWGLSTFPVYVMYPADPFGTPFLVSDNFLSQAEVLAALEKGTRSNGT